MIHSLSMSISGYRSSVTTSERIRVVGRIRPSTGNEQLAVRVVNDQAVEVDLLSPSLPATSSASQLADSSSSSANRPRQQPAEAFTLDKLYTGDSSQETLFLEQATLLIESVLTGYNATIFAYGQSGAGKSYTMSGTEADPGIIPRAAAALFAAAASLANVSINVSYIEIYMEKIRCLIDTTQLNLAVREDHQGRGIFVDGATELQVGTKEALMDVIAAGSAHRKSSSTGLNDQSSRSHSVVTITVVQRDTSNGISKSGKLVLVDLAGSDMARKSKVQGQQLEEAKAINKSLSALGNVINALSEGSAHIPYRDSKLTRILQDSLGGNSRTLLIVAISPSSFNASETVSTLRFAVRAKTIENKVMANTQRTDTSSREAKLLALLAEKDAVIAALQAPPPPPPPLPLPLLPTHEEEEERERERLELTELRAERQQREQERDAALQAQAAAEREARRLKHELSQAKQSLRALSSECGNLLPEHRALQATCANQALKIQALEQTIREMHEAKRAAKVQQGYDEVLARKRAPLGKRAEEQEQGSYKENRARNGGDGRV